MKSKQARRLRTLLARVAVHCGATEVHSRLDCLPLSWLNVDRRLHAFCSFLSGYRLPTSNFCSDITHTLAPSQEASAGYRNEDFDIKPRYHDANLMHSMHASLGGIELQAHSIHHLQTRIIWAIHKTWIRVSQKREQIDFIAIYNPRTRTNKCFVFIELFRRQLLKSQSSILFWRRSASFGEIRGTEISSVLHVNLDVEFGFGAQKWPKRGTDCPWCTSDGCWD